MPTVATPAINTPAVFAERGRRPMLSGVLSLLGLVATRETRNDAL